jgi:hypothetical protein
LLLDRGIISTEGYQATPGPGYYKRYLSITGLPKSDWCLEYNNGFREKYPTTHLWLTVRKTPESTKLFIKATIVNFTFGKHIIIPLEIPPEVEQDTILDSLYAQVTKIVEELIKIQI